MAYKKPENVAGLIRNQDGRFLESMVDELESGDCVIEIGPFTGKSTCFMGRGVRESHKTIHIYSVDPWELLGAPISGTGLTIAQTRKEVHELFRANVKKCGMTDIITEFHGFSEDAADRWNSPSPIGMVYVDGNHKYPMVKKDIELWAPKIKVGGYMVFHDYNSPQVHRAVNELVRAGLPHEETADLGRWVISGPQKHTERFAVLERRA